MGDVGDGGVPEPALRTSRRDPSGLCRAECFLNSLCHDLAIVVLRPVPAFLPYKVSVGPRASGDVVLSLRHIAGNGEQAKSARYGKLCPDRSGDRRFRTCPVDLCRKA